MNNLTGLMFSALSAALLCAAGASFAAAGQLAAQSPSPAPSPFIVNIKDNAFSPNKLAVPVGATVTWKNQDSYAHTVTAKDKGGFDSGNLDGGKSFSMTFSKRGTFYYICAIHPSMAGIIVVGEADQPSTPPPPSGY